MTIDLGSRSVADDGTVICNQQALVELLYSGQTIDNIFCSDQLDSQEWQEAARQCDSQDTGPQYASGSQYLGIHWYNYWNTPDPWASIDLSVWLHDKCQTTEEHDRVDYELELITERHMQPLLKHLIYCVDTWRNNNVVWGVGRGSSVCSFVLYLIGINRINPLEYGLDIKEWLK